MEADPNPFPPKKRDSTPVLVWIAVLMAAVLGIVIGGEMTQKSTPTDPVAATTTTSTTSTTTTKPTTTTAVTTSEDLFWEVVHDKWPNVSRANAVALAKAACDVIDEYGMEAASRIIVAQALEHNVPVEMAGTIVGAGVPTYCPWNTGQLKNLH